jgi:FMN phosphatase YigB (HAD superfamily)
MSDRRYRFVLIDADNTLLNFAACEKRILETMAYHYGFMPITVDGEDLVGAYRRLNAELWRRLERGEIAPEELKIERFRRLRDILNFTALSRPVGAEFLNRRFIDALSRCGDVVPTAAGVLASIGPVSIITNGFAAVQRPRLEQSGLMPMVDNLFISEEIGAAKPRAAFFDHVLQAVGNPDPRDCVVVGDSLTSDIAGGNAAGMDTVWFDRRGTLGESAGVQDDIDANTPTYRITRLVELRPIVLSDSTITGRHR